MAVISWWEITKQGSNNNYNATRRQGEVQTDDCMHRHLTCEILKKYIIYNLDNNVLFIIYTLWLTT